MQLRISTFNCGGFKQNIGIVKKLLQCNEIVCIQETMIHENNANIFNEIDPNFNYVYVSAYRKEDQFRGRSAGGLIIYFRKNLSHLITPFQCANNINGIWVKENESQHLIINCYMPCDYRTEESIIEYRQTIAKLSNILDEEIYSSVCIIGDFNADTTKRFYKEIKDFAEIYELKIADVEFLPLNSFTYVSSNDHASTSWLDHVMTSNIEILQDIKIYYELSFYDHIPMSFKYNIKNIEHIEHTVNDQEYEFVLWNKVTEEEIETYQDNINFLCDDYKNKALRCNVQNCKNIKHISKLDLAYEYAIDLLFIASDHFETRKSNENFKRVPGWNMHCKDLYNKARENFIKWKENSKCRFGHEFEEMKQSRKEFKIALKFCKDNEIKLKKDKLVSSYHENSKNNFWKDVKTLNKTNKEIPNKIDNKTDRNEIVDIFKNKYKAILDDPLSQCKPMNYKEIMEKIESQTHVNNCKLYDIDIKDAIDKLKIGIGIDFVHSNHLKQVGGKYRQFIADLFSAFLNHNYLPKNMLNGEIRPLIKNKTNNKSDSSNYRPVMASSNMLKMFEYCLLPTMNRYIKHDQHQFGYRKNTSCLNVTSVLKETILNYTNKSTSVHCAILDMSKAFDKINHHILVKKLVEETNLPLPIIRMIKYMNENQNVWISFNNQKGEKWEIKNGTRQGGVLSGLIFNFYINKILQVISELNAGCSIAMYKVNILGYADDIILICPSANGLQFLMNKLYLMLDSLCLILNTDKSVYMVFKTGKHKNYQFDAKIHLNGKKLKRVNECRYLGVILSDDMSIEKDIQKCSSTFLKQFNSMYSKFGYLNTNMIRFLFNSYCTSFYGAELWFNKKNAKKEFNRGAISYHKAIKRMANLTPWDSNHEACEKLDLPTFKHMINSKMLKFYMKMLNSKSPCLVNLKSYYRNDAFIKKAICEIFDKEYNIGNIFDNDLMAVNARIEFVQRHEPRSCYMQRQY